MGERWRIKAGLLVACLLVGGCGGGPASDVPADDGDSSAVSLLSVYVVNYPLQYFAERIGGDTVQVEFPAATAGDPAFWEPGPEAIVAFQNADLILLNGAGYAKWTVTATLPGSKLVDTGTAFADRTIEIENAVTHSHGPEGDHSHGDTAFTTWLDPTLAADNARAIRTAFVAARPDREAEFDAGLESLLADLAELDAALETATAAAAGRPLMGSHPVYQYLARRYSLDLRSVHYEPDEEPDARAQADLDEILAVHPATLMLWEAEPLAATVEMLEGRGLRSVVFDPCSDVPTTGDWLAVMRANAEALASALDASSGNN